MSLSSLLLQGMNNIPQDGEEEAPVIDGGRVTSPLARARYETYVKFADTSYDLEDDDSPGERFKPSSIQANNAAVTHERMVNEAIALRK